MMFLDCPAYLNQDGTVRCGLPAEVTCRFTMRSTDGPLDCAMTRCPAGHWFNGPIESLTWDSTDIPTEPERIVRPRTIGTGHRTAAGAVHPPVHSINGGHDDIS